MPHPNTDMDVVDWSRMNWVIRRVLDLLMSPHWIVPIESFVDSRCEEFVTYQSISQSVNPDENAHEAITFHLEFIQLIDSILETSLAVLGISQKEFITACSIIMRESQSDDARVAEKKAHNRALLNSLLACDDFESFRSWMVTRNLAIEEEVMNELKNIQNLSENGQLNSSTTPDYVDDEQLLAQILALSIHEAELLAVEFEREQAELAMAIAMSLALDQQIQEATESLAALEQAEAAAGDVTSTDTPHDHEARESKPTPPAKLLRAASRLGDLKLKPRPDIDASKLLTPARPAPVADTTSRPAEISSRPNADPSDSTDLLARRRFLREQRELLIQKKRQAGEQAVKEWQSQSSSSSEDSSSQKLKTTGLDRDALVAALREAENKRRTAV